jgi:energy-coupling factor transporter ATP-binding protein EcfA2
VNNTSFPHELLTQSIEDRINYFRNYTIVHPHLKQVYEDLKHSIKYSTSGSLIFLYGPSGVGKTTLIQKLYEDIFEETHSELIADPVRLPAVLTRATAADSSNFDWKDFFQRLLIGLNDFLPDRRVDNTRWEELNLQNNKILENDKTSLSSYRKAAENSLKHRKPYGVFVDEAQEIGTVASSRKLLRQTNVLKSLAEETKISHILSGTYELLSLRNLNGQLSRRSIEIHFPRYNAHSRNQRIIFRNALWTFQQHLPFEEMPDLVSHWEYIFERSVGCVGTVKDWLTRSYSWALEKNKKTLTLEDLQKREPSIAQSIRSLEEILEGEKNLKRGNEALESLRNGLGLNIPEGKLRNHKNKSSARKNKSVGTRLPKRDPIKKKD